MFFRITSAYSTHHHYNIQLRFAHIAISKTFVGHQPAQTYACRAWGGRCIKTVTGIRTQLRRDVHFTPPQAFNRSLLIGVFDELSLSDLRTISVFACSLDCFISHKERRVFRRVNEYLTGSMSIMSAR